jgi:hypothetical protein
VSSVASSSIVIALPPGGRGFQPARAAEVVVGSGLPKALGELAAGPFGLPSLAVACLEALADAVDIAAEAARRLQGHVLEALAAEGGTGLVLPTLPPEQRELVGAMAVVVAADLALRRLSTLTDAPTVEGALERDGLAGLLRDADPPEALLQRVLTMARRYLELRRATVQAEEGAQARTQATVRTLAAFLVLLRRAVLGHAESGTLRPLAQALARRGITIVGHAYHGLQIRDAATRGGGSGLLPVRPPDVVGNDDYLRAGLRLAHDVAGYDFATRRNPKRINPVLFGLGRPGCGKTVTAHAIGNDFLDYCRERDVPARFLVVRRTDWASSYQNASALNLVRLFEEEVYGFSGVCGVYWPDIDTALASRSSSGLRMEEKQNLGAVFGIFDGTLLPRDGKWFLVCDANTLHMDEAATSRIAQNPFTVTGPTTPACFVRLMRELELRDVARLLDLDADAWARVGARAVALGLSGRAAAAVCGNLLAHAQDFELPPAWFHADAAERERIWAGLGRRIDEVRVVGELERWAAFHAEAEARAEDERFEQEVDALVRRLNAGRVAAQRVSAAALHGEGGEPT